MSGSCCLNYDQQNKTEKQKTKEKDSILILYYKLNYFDFLRTKYIFQTDGHRTSQKSLLL